MPDIALPQCAILTFAYISPVGSVQWTEKRRNDMIENLKSVLIGLTKEFGPEETSSALGYGLALAQQAGAHVTVQAASVKVAVSTAKVSKVVAGLVQEENQRLQALAEAVARSARGDAGAAGIVCTAAAPHLSYPELIAVFRMQARLHDLTIVDAEPEALTPDRGLIEALLMDSGRPLLVVPAGQEVFSARRIILAWDGSGRAARAAADALPFLRAADTVEVVAVMGEKDLPASVTGADIAPHLTRHGVNVTVQTLPAVGGDVAETLRNHATLTHANMIVMGGYVHSRLRELVFGGVTQSLLKQNPVPLLLSY
jgi:nucleotide-binding universal stress UspA family protein